MQLSTQLQTHSSCFVKTEFDKSHREGYFLRYFLKILPEPEKCYTNVLVQLVTNSMSDQSNRLVVVLALNIFRFIKKSISRNTSFKDIAYQNVNMA